MQIRCPHCRNAIELLNDSSLTKVSCRSCGHDFNLTHDDTIIQPGSPDADTGVPTYPAIAHFQLIEAIGIGAFGSVWRAHDEKLDRMVAIKIPRKEQLSKEDAAQFLREARAAAQLKHPNIVPVHEVGRENGNIYIVSDFIEGRSMDKWLKEKRPSIKKALAICIKLANALSHAHKSGIIHRDLKPANVLIDPAGEPHLTDFGLAKKVSGEITMTIQGNILGTPAYMPPEQAAGDAHNADSRSDVYSLGVILYEILTGECPFRGNINGVLSQVLNDEPQSPRKLDRQIPRDLETITLKCLEKKPARRFQSAKELTNELKRFQKGEPILSRPVSTLNRIWRWAQRKPALAGFVTTVSLLLLTLAVGGPIIASRENSLRIQADRSTQEAQEAAIRESDAKNLAQKETARALREEKRTRQQVRVARANMYLAHMRLAMQDLEAGNIKNVRRLLDLHIPPEGEPDLRSFDWYYLWKRSHPPVTLLRHDEGTISATAFAPNGKIFYSASSTGTIKAWDAKTNRTIFSLNIHLGNESNQGGMKSPAMILSPNGKILATGGFDGLIKLWDATTGKSIAALESNETAIISLAFSDDSKWLASGDIFGSVFLWDVVKHKQVASIKAWEPMGRIYGLEFSGEGKTLLLAGGPDGTVKRWNPDDGKLEVDFTANRGIETLWFVVSADKRWAITNDYTGSTRLWDLSLARGKDFKPVKKLRFFDWPAFSPDSKSFCGIKTHQINFLDLGKLQHKGTVETLVEPTATVFSPDNNRVIIGGGNGTVKLVKVSDTKDDIRLLGQKSKVDWTAFSPDGKTGVTCGLAGTPQFWDIDTSESLFLDAVHPVKYGKRIQKREPGTAFGEIGDFVLWSPNGKYMATTGRSGASLFDAKSRELIHNIKIPGSTWALSFSPDSRHIAMGHLFGGVRLWDIKQEKLIHVFRESLPNSKTGNASRMILSVAFSPDGKQVIAGGQASGLTVWDVKSGKEVQSFAPLQSWIDSIKYSPDGTLIASLARGKGVKTWDARTFKQKSNYALQYAGGDMVFTQDGKRLLVPDRTAIVVLDVNTGENVARLLSEKYPLPKKRPPGHGMIFSLAVSPDGTKVLTGEARTVKLWEAATPKEVEAWNSP